MNALMIIRALGPIDVRTVHRDALLRWIILLPLVLALAARWPLPGLLAQMETILGWPLLPFYPPIMSYSLVALVPFIVGFVIGFLLLDQRDDQTLVALQVTPLSLHGYLAYRLALPMFISLLVTVVVIPMSGLVQLTWGRLLLAALIAAPQAPLFALALAALAQNKVQGFALMKASSVVLLPPLASYFIGAPWHYLLGIVPTYWPAQVFWGLQESRPVALFLIVGTAYQLVWVGWLARHLQKVMTG